MWEFLPEPPGCIKPDNAGDLWGGTGEGEELQKRNNQVIL